MYDQAKDVDDCECDRLRDLEIKRVLYWTRRLSLRPDEVRQMTSEQLQYRLLLVEQAEHAQERRMEQFKRWQNLCELRWLMYEVQREFNEKHGTDGIGVSIWRILELEQEKLEKELQLDDMLGNLKRFPSPMSVMVPECETDDRLKPLQSVLTGLANSCQLNGQKKRHLREEAKRKRTPFTDALYEREMRLLEESTDDELVEKFEKADVLHCCCSENRMRGLSSQGIGYDLQQDLDIELELQKIKESTARCDWIIEALFAPCPEQCSQTSETNVVQSVPFVHNLLTETESDVKLDNTPSSSDYHSFSDC